MSESVAYKAFLHGDKGTQAEARRFAIDKDVSTNFVYLQGKAVVVFPDLKDKVFNITWRDADGDDVTIAGDEDLKIALAEMSGSLHKINITVKGTKPIEDDAEKSGEQHPGVTCNGCDGNVVGFRYKCLVCPDYDLCSSCEHKGLHPGHNMMRMPSVMKVPLPQNFFKRIQRLQERAEKKEKYKENMEGKEESENAEGWQNEFWFGGPHWGRGGMRGCGPRGRGGMGGRGMFGGPAFGRPHPPPPPHHGGPHPPPPSFAPMFGGPNIFDGMMQGWMGMQNPCPTGTPDSKEHDEACKKARDDAQAAHVAAHEAAKATAAAAHSVATAGLKVAEEVVKAFTEGYSSQETKATEKTTKAPEETDDDASTAAGKQIKATPEASIQQSATGDNLSTKDEEDWDMIKDSATSPSMYPKLPDESEKSSKPTTSVKIPIHKVPAHPDPKIQVGLEAMINMGFSNEGGWLTTLLEAKDGDIAKVLDILQPAKK